MLKWLRHKNEKCGTWTDHSTSKFIQPDERQRVVEDVHMIAKVVNQPAVESDELDQMDHALNGEDRTLDPTMQTQNTSIKQEDRGQLQKDKDDQGEVLLEEEEKYDSRHGCLANN